MKQERTTADKALDDANSDRQEQSPIDIDADGDNDNVLKVAPLS